MAFLNSNNFCKWIDPANTDEFTEDGDFNNGVGVSDLPFWNLDDTSPIGDDEVAWTWISGADDFVQVSSVLSSTTGFSQKKTIEKGKIYHIEADIWNIEVTDVTFYFYFVGGSTNQLIKSITIDTNRENRDFFIEADADYSKILVVAIAAADHQTRIYKLKITEFDGICFYTLPLFKGDGINIFINGVLDNAVDVFSQLKVGLWNDNGIYLRDIASLNQIVISGDNYSMYIDEWIVPPLPVGNFRFIIYDDSNGYDIELYLSNSFQKVPNTNYTAFVKYNNSVDTLGYLYESAPSFFNEFRIDLWTGRPNFNENVKGYETYEGDLIRVKSDIQKLVEFQTRFFDDGAHEAFFSMLSHSSIEIDGITYKKGEQSYDITWSEDDNNKIGNGIVNLLVDDYSAAIKTC